MSELNLNIENVLVKLSKGILSNDEACNILNNPTEHPTEIFETLSIETALKYWYGNIDYNAGDYIMNNIFKFCVMNHRNKESKNLSSIVGDCYIAFDAGEFYRKEDGPNTDPVEKYTKPLIEIFLRNRNLIK